MGLCYGNDAGNACKRSFENWASRRIKMRGKAKYLHFGIGLSNLLCCPDEVEMAREPLLGDRFAYVVTGILVNTEHASNPTAKTCRRGSITAHDDEFDIEASVARNPRRLDKFMNTLYAQKIADKSHLKGRRAKGVVRENVRLDRRCDLGKRIVNDIDPQVGRQTGFHCLVYGDDSFRLVAQQVGDASRSQAAVIVSDRTDVDDNGDLEEPASQ